MFETILAYIAILNQLLVVLYCGYFVSHKQRLPYTPPAFIRVCGDQMQRNADLGWKDRNLKF